MADDINVVFAADTTQLDAAVGKVKSEMQSLVPGAPGSGILTPLPQAFGGAPSTLLERATAAAKANAAAAAQAGTAMKNFGRDLEETGGKAQRAGIDFGAMAERIAVRLVIFEAIRLAIKGMMDAFKEVAGFETATVQFENLSKNVGETTDAENMLIATTKSTNQEFAKLSSAVLSLEDAGEGPHAAAAEVDLLAKRATATGDDVDKLAKALERVKLGEGTVQDMFELAHAAGTAKDELLDDVSAFARLQREIKNTNDLHAEGLRVLKEETHEIEHQLDVQIAASREKEKAISDEFSANEKLAGLQESFSERQLRAKEAEGKPGAAPAQMDPMLATFLKGGAGLSPAAIKQINTDLQAGAQQFAKENELNDAQFQRYLNTGRIGYRDLMDAAKRKGEADVQAAKDAQAAETTRLEAQKKTAGETLQKATDAEAERRRATALGQDQARYDLSQKLVKAMGDQNNISDQLAKSMGTINEKFASAATSLKEMVHNAPLLVSAMKSVADFAEKTAAAIKSTGVETKVEWDPGKTFNFGKIFGDITGASGFGEIMKGLQGLTQIFSGKTELTEKNSDKIERHLSQLNETLTGH